MNSIDVIHNEQLETIQGYEDLIPNLQKEKAKIKHILKTKHLQIDDKMNYQDRLIEIKELITKYKNARTKYHINNFHHVFDYYESKMDTLKNDNEQQTLNSFFNINPPEKELYRADQYLYNVKGIFKIEEVDTQTCQCGGEFIQQEGVMICNKCFIQNNHCFDELNTNSGDEHDITSCYKKINHFKEILKQIQGKESYTILEEDLAVIRKHIEKYRIDTCNMDVQQMKVILQKLKMKKLYEHVNLVRKQLGLHVPLMSSAMEDKLINMFLLIQPIYQKYVPDHKTNFLNYHYCLSKMCELVQETKYLYSLQMLKERNKIIESDNIWQKICLDLEWEFIPTI